MIELNKIYNEDCLEGMKRIESGSVDMILCDLPYGTTACKWDVIIPFESLWEQYKRIIKPNGAIVLTASQPFTTKLIASNYNMFRYCWIWQKNRPTGFLDARRRPLNDYEDVCVFSGKSASYYPQGLVKGNYKNGRPSKKNRGYMQGRIYNAVGYQEYSEFSNYPKRVINFSYSNAGSLHPTQKPVALFEYLIRTYTNEGDTVLDSCMGSGTTAVACINANRNFIGFELDKEYFDKANKRILHTNKPLF